jgi:tripartite ATP-independent transporter DctM subunit
MEWYWTLGLLLTIFIGLLVFGIPVALSFLATNTLGWLVVSKWDPLALLQIVDNISSMVSRFTLGPIPLFILMGSIFFNTNLATRVFNTIDILLGRLPGRLSFLTLFGGTSFSTLIGSSIANTAMLGTLMLPEMRKRGYNKQMSLGPILGTGGLAIIIPPSAMAVLLASIADIDVGAFLIAGIIPGFVLATLYMLMIALQIYINPDSAPSYNVERIGLTYKIKLVLVNILPMFILIFSIIGVIITGIATPTESAAIGVLTTVILAICYNNFSFTRLQSGLSNSVKVSGAIFFILMNSAVFSQLLSFSGASKGLMTFALGFDLGPYAILILMIVLLLVIGMFMDSSSIMLVSIPIMFPIAQAIGIDLLLFAMIMLITIEMAGITPPFGVVLYTLMGTVKDVQLGELVKAASPFLLCDFVLIVLLIVFPGLALWLPSLI